MTEPLHSEQSTALVDVTPAQAHVPPEFDRREVAEFGKDDGAAVTVIGKMLVGFFFYSMLVMLFVAYWTWKSHHVVPTEPAHATEEAEE